MEVLYGPYPCPFISKKQLLNLIFGEGSFSGNAAQTHKRTTEQDRAPLHGAPSQLKSHIRSEFSLLASDPPRSDRVAPVV